jgi:ribonucleotide reductase alpha subunit
MDNNLSVDYTQWERGKDYPEYFDEVALSTISKGYLLPGETPRKAYRRVAHAVAMRLNRPDLENKFLFQLKIKCAIFDKRNEQK